MNKIVIVMPSYNEAKNITLMVKVLFDDIFNKINADMHLLVVDDNSPDGTGDIVKNFQKKYKNLHLLSGKKEGLGMAYVRGFRYAMDKLNADATIEMDSDFQHDPKFLKPMVDAYLAGADYVVGSRYVSGGSIPKDWAWHRKAVSYWGNMFVRIVLFLPRLHDATTGFRLTKVQGVLDKIKLEELMELHRFAYKVDLFYQSVKLSKKTVEVPIAFATRKEEKSKFSLKEMISTYKVVIMLRILSLKRFIKFGLVGGIGFLVNAIGLEFFRSTPLSISLADYFAHLEGVPIAQLLNTPSAWAAAFAAEVSIISNYTFNNFWTFKDARVKGVVNTLLKFIQFNLTSLGAIIIQFAVVGKATLWFGDTSATRQIALFIAVVFLIIPYNYTAYNIFIWKTWKISNIVKKLRSIL